MINRNYLFLILILIIGILGCTKEQDVLTFAVGGAPNEVEYWEKLIKKFEDSSNIKVKIIRQPTDTDQRRQGLVIPLKAKEKDPDVFLMDVIWVSQFAASDWLLSLNPFLETSDLDLNSFFSGIIQQVDMYRQTLVAFPVYNDCGLLYYRKDLLQKHKFSVPETWQKLSEMATKIQNKEREQNPQFFGFLWQGAQYEGLVCTFLEFAASNRGGFVDDAGKIKVDNIKNIEALQFMIDMIHNYKISPPNTFTEMKEEEVRISFENGNALFERNWPYAWGLHKRDESQIKEKVGISILPKFPEGTNAATLGGWHIGISKFSDQKDKAWKLVEYILSYETQKRLALDLGWNPGRSDIYNDTEVIEKMPHIETIKKAFENAVARPNLPYYTQASEVIQRYLNAALSGKLKPEEALIQSQKEIEKVVEIYHDPNRY